MKAKYYLSIYWLLSFSLLMNFKSSSGQELKQKFTIYNQEQGLNSSTITQMELDSKGFLWLLSESGLSRFDGYHFLNQIYKGKDGLKSQTPRVHAFYLNQCGSILINTHQGLAMSNINKSYFETIYPWEESNDWGSFIKNKHYFIFQKKNNLIVVDSLGNLLSAKDLTEAHIRILNFSFDQYVLASQNRQLGTYNFINGTFKAFPNNAVNINSADEVQICKLPFSNKEQIIITPDSIYRFDPRTLKITPLGTPLKEFKSIFQGSIQLLPFNDSICYIANQNLMHQLKQIGAKITLNSFTLPFSLKDMQVKSTNEIWLIAKDRGLYKLTINGNEIEKVICPNSAGGLNTDLNIEALCSNGLCCWYTSPGNGLIKMEESPKLFSSYAPPIFNLNGTQNPSKLNVRSICNWQSNEVLVGTLQGLFTFNFNKKTFSKLKLNAPLDFSNFPTSAIETDPEGDTWISHWNELNLYCIYKKDLTVKNFLSIKDSKKIKGTIRSLYFDSKGNLWLGTPDNKIYLVNWKTLKHQPNQTRFQELTPQDAKIKSFGIVFNFMQVDSFSVFIASETGLLEYNYKTQSLRLHRLQIPHKEVIKNIRSIVNLGNHELFLGTHGNGIVHYNFLTGTVKVFMEPNGLSNNIVYSLIIDKNKKFLWAGTNNGLSRFNLKTNTFTSFSTRDGLQNAEFNTNASAVYQEAYYIFGGVQGISIFKPELVVEPRFYNPVYITEIKINGKVFEPKSDTETIQLTYPENNLSFQFAGLGKWRNEEYKYAYQLTGVDSNWVFCGTLREVSYLNLKPGDYTFKVRVYDFYGHYTELKKPFIFNIGTPWFKKWWFYTIVVFVIFSFTILFIKLKLNQVLTLQRMRDTIAKDLHDEVGANLSNIALFIAILKQKINESTTESINIINKINQFAESSQDSMSDIVWMINSNNDEFENLTIKMKDYTNLIAEDSPIQISYQLSNSLSKIKLDMLSRKNIYLFFKEALNNALKHSKASKIEIITKWTGSQLSLQIIDNGIGFDATQVFKGNGLNNLQKRSEQLKGELIIKSNSNKGTSVELLCEPFKI